MKSIRLRISAVLACFAWLTLASVPALGVGSVPALGCSCASAQESPRDALVALLEDHQSRIESGLEELEFGLLQLRADAIDPLFEVLCLRGIPADWRLENAVFMPLDGELLRLMERSLLGLSGARLRLLFKRIEHSEARELLRTKAFQMLAKFGAVDDVRLMLDLATPLGSRSGILALAMRRKLEAALIRLGERDPMVTAELGRVFLDLHEGLQPSLIRVLGQTGDLGALRVLTGILNSDRDLDPCVLNAIARCARRVPHPIDPAYLRRVRNSLGVSDQHIALGAMAAMGSLEDFDALPFLLEALGSEEDSVRRQASLSLRELVGLRYGGDERRWRRWYERESAWWIQEVPQLMRDIKSGTMGEARAAIESISGARLDRHELSLLLLHALGRREPELLRLVCVGLARKGSRLAIKPLIDLLRHREELVVQAAHRALMDITQMIIPADPKLWSIQVAAL